MDIKHNAEQRRFEIEVDGYKAHVAYSIHDNGLDIRHTIVPSEIGGRGIASALVKAAYDFAKSHQEAFIFMQLDFQNVSHIAYKCIPNVLF